MSIEERVSRLEKIFECSGRMKSEAEVREIINNLKIELKVTQAKANSEKGAKQKETRILCYKIQDKINILEELFN